MKIYQYIYINYFIFLLNNKLKLNLSNYLLKDYERLILFKHLIYSRFKDKKLKYDIKEKFNLEFLYLNKKIEFISYKNIKKYSDEINNKQRIVKRVKTIVSHDNVINLNEYLNKMNKKV